jgi:predicted amidohydrolase YtcJ
MKKGEIIFAGSIDEAENFQKNITEMKNFKNKTILPGFINAASHFWNAGFLALSANLAKVPYGTCTNIDAIISLSNNSITSAQKKSLAMSSFTHYIVAIL